MSGLAPVLVAAAALAVIGYRLRRRYGRPAPVSHSDRAPRLGSVGIVAGREIRERVRARAFRIATAFVLLGVAAAIVIPTVVRGGPHTERVALVGTGVPELRASVTAAGRSTGTAVTTTTPGRAAAERALRSGHLDLVVVDGTRILVDKPTDRDGSFPRALAVLIGLGNASRAAHLSTAQQERLAQARPLPVVSLRPGVVKTSGRSSAAVAMVVMFILLTQYLTWTLMGVMEEKSSRVVEVLLAAVRPLQLLAGKVLGIAAVVFLQAAIVAGFALVVARAVGSDLLHGQAPLVLLSAAAWVVLGYAFYSWLYAAAGSTVERQDQVQTLALPLSLPLIAGYILGLTVAGSGSAPTWFEVLAYLPPTAPFAMTTLVGLGVASWWQFALSAAVSVAATVGTARLAATVYRRAILRTGRRVPLKELFGGRRRDTA